ncbi:phosphonate ABC transporter, permease protein PhnE [Limnohabitans sp. Rim8]|uniref:phosphonate ABC transporter, permease protein PhnE n=1 Tax=Limnohabitans sp. Rim8 TaxID=1100718 RepID=UPI0025F82464|nr:phosphonate ABC transporter, permease protein PhnE [Limnohabitans sp. Rim8]
MTTDAQIAKYPQHFRTVTRHRVITITVITLLLGLLIFSFYRLDFSAMRIFTGLSKLLDVTRLMFPPDPGWGPTLLRYLHAMVETVAIAFLGTLIAALLAFPLASLAARNTSINRLVHFLSRRTFDTLRGVDTLIWALIWINVVGLGPFAGVLAIICSDLGSFGKLFSEAIEAADRKPVEGIASTGGSRIQQIRFGIVPQVLPVFLSQVLYYFESNTRSATIIGIVGAGGIGLILSEQIRTLEFQQVSFVILMILVTVSAIDWLCSKLRFKVIGQPQH